MSGSDREDSTVKKKRFTEQQIAFALLQAASGTPVAEIRRLKQLEEENRRLKQLVADLTLDKQTLQDVLSKTL